MRVLLLTAFLSSSAFAGWEYITRNGAQYYGNQFSEENGGMGPSAPARGFTGWKCYGGNCDDKKMRIPTNGDNILAGVDVKVANDISEEGGRSTMECGNRLLSRLKCEGGNCDNTDVWCRDLAQGYRVVTATQWWSGWFSEEQGPYDCPANYWLWGMQCGGGRCDNQRLRCVRVQKWIPKNCAVSAWTAWGGCSKTCATGTQKRTRTVTQNPESGGNGLASGQACPGLEETRNCNTQACPVDCVVSGFGEWGACDAECDGGKQTRTKTVTTPAANGGKACPSLSEERACNEQDCICQGVKNSDDYANTLTKVKKGENQFVQLVDKNDPICECYDLCTDKEADIFLYYLKKNGSAKCKCMKANPDKFKINMKARTGYTSGFISDAGKKNMDAKKNKKSRRGRRN